MRKPFSQKKIKKCKFHFYYSYEVSQNQNMHLLKKHSEIKYKKTSFLTASKEQH